MFSSPVAVIENGRHTRINLRKKEKNEMMLKGKNRSKDGLRPESPGRRRLEQRGFSRRLL